MMYPPIIVTYLIVFNLSKHNESNKAQREIIGSTLRLKQEIIIGKEDNE